MKRITAALTAITLVCLAQAGIAQDEKPEVKVTALKGNLHLLQGRGGNVVASVGDDGILLVDDDYAEYAEAYEEALVGLGGDGATARFVINTHWHFDHVGGNNFWGERGAVIVAHHNVYERMSTRQEMKAFNRVVEPSPLAALPKVTFGDSLALRVNGGTIEVRHMPRGHTDGDSVVYFTSENLLHMGDHYFKDRFPFVDIGSGGNVFGFTANIEAALALADDDTVVIPGHGDIADKADLKRYHDMLVSTSAMVKAKLEEGMTVEAITEAGLGDEWDSWGSGFINEERWISFIAGSL